MIKLLRQLFPLSIYLFIVPSTQKIAKIVKFRTRQSNLAHGSIGTWHIFLLLHIGLYQLFFHTQLIYFLQYK